MSAKDYVRLVPRKVMQNARTTPRVGRPWRTRSLSRLTTFYRNRFYEIDRWYKARIPHIPEHPVCYNIQPDAIHKTLVERLQELGMEDPVLHEKVDIGLSYSPSPTSSSADRQAILTEMRKNPDLERSARNCKILLDLPSMDSDDFSHGPMPGLICQAAKHCGIFRDLFHPDAYFYPTVALNVGYQADSDVMGGEIGDYLLPVHFGNTIEPSQAQQKPTVNFPSGSEENRWTLLMVNPDGNVYEDGQDVCHWLVTNIKKNNVDSGDVIVDYLPPLPLRGTGYHRVTFILFKQDSADPLDFTRYKSEKPFESRTFSTSKFYKENEDVITPAGLAFFQSQWDVSCTECFQKVLDMPEPGFEHIPDHVDLPVQQEFPKKESFDKYLDRYRDRFDMEQEVLQKRLARISPFKPDEPRYPYPNIFKTLEEQEVQSSWLRERREKERLGLGRFKGLYENKMT